MEDVLKIGLLADSKPDVFFDLKNGQGTFLYNHNIKEVNVTKDKDNIIVVTGKTKETSIMFQYDSIRIEYPKTRANIFATLLGAKYPPSIESKLMNEYRSAELGLLDDSYKTPYEEFLQDRLNLRASIKDDCETYNVPDNS
ncbi:MAG: hypothetical protein LBE04_05080 [Prevotellaceae bacterium]|jgi:hypothetical protein|nr:hypothetical protein [Prevotellaceae bacterium]